MPAEKEGGMVQLHIHIWKLSTNCLQTSNCGTGVESPQSHLFYKATADTVFNITCTFVTSLKLLQCYGKALC